uniref:Uncharacterized protein n=1 Tax=Romanomermis culicivorax TaxID=13658 RepID=A0A915HRR0_ROMCU
FFTTTLNGYNSLQCSQGPNITESIARKKRDSVSNGSNVTFTHFLKQRSNIPVQFLDKINLRQKMALNANNDSHNSIMHHKRLSKKKKRVKMTKNDIFGTSVPEKATTTPDLVTRPKSR